MIYYGNELYHHGIKGQKWGDRNYQYEDGSLTPEGKKRYGVGDGRKGFGVKTIPKNVKRQTDPEKLNGNKNDSEEKISNKKTLNERTLKSIEKYKQKGYSQEEAEKIVKSRKIVTGVLLGIGATAAVAATAYAIKKKYPELVDRTIESGDVLKRIDTADSLHDVAYVARNKADAAKYKGLYGAQKLQALGESGYSGQIKQLTIGAKDKIRIASDKNAKATFDELMKNDSDFRKTANGILKAQGGMINGQRAKSSYDVFNLWAANDHSNEKINQAYEKFYGALKNKGYGGIRDLNDIRYSGYKSKDPLIIFNTGKLSVNNASSLSLSTIKNAEAKEMGKMAVKSTLASLGVMGVGATVVGGSTYLNNTNSKNIAKKYP